LGAQKGGDNYPDAAGGGEITSCKADEEEKVLAIIRGTGESDQTVGGRRTGRNRLYKGGAGHFNDPEAFQVPGSVVGRKKNGRRRRIQGAGGKKTQGEERFIQVVPI